MATETFMRHGVVLVTLAVLQIKASGVVLDLLRVESDIEHRYAVTQVTAAYVNLHNSSQEVSLRMTLPKDAYVSSLVIDVGGKNHSTVVAEKEQVRRTGPKTPHEENSRHRRRGENTQKFRASAKARGLQNVIFYLTYEQLLLRRQGSYTFDIHLGVAKRLENVEVKLRLFETEEIRDFQVVRLPWTSSQTLEENITVEEVTLSPGEVTASFSLQNITVLDVRKESAAGDDDADVYSEDGDPSTFSVSYDVDRKSDGGEMQILGDFFVHRFSPEGLPKLPTHTVFVLDVSGSMHDNGKLTQLKVAMRAILTSLPPEDSFEILVFSTRVTSLGVFQAVPEEVERSLTRIQRLQALGGTNFNEAFLRALQDVNNFNLTSGAKQVVFLTDGRANLGEKKPSQLRRNVREANIHQLPIHSLGLGHDADMRLLRQVSTDNQGFSGKIDEDAKPAEQLKSFYDKISSPLMTDIEIMYMDDEVDTSSIVKQGPSTFYAGDEMVLAGQLREGVKEVQPLVTGRGNEGPMQLKVSRISAPEKAVERDNYVERLWAYLTVKDLLEMQEVVEDRNLKAEMNFRALEIALQFQFVTKLTSLKPEEEEDEEEAHQEGQSILSHKSASRYQKSNTGTLTLFYDHLALLSEAEFAKTLPAPLSTRLNTASNNRFSFGDNDPHFVVQVPGMDMPFCFDIHGQHGQVLSLVRDENSGIIVNGLVTSAVGRPEATYFTELFMGLGKVNFTVTPHNITITFLQGHKNSKIPRVLRSVWPFKKMYKKGKKGQKGKKKSRRRSKGQTPRERRALSGSRAEDPLSANPTRTREIKRFRDSSTRFQKQKTKPKRILRHGIMNDYNYNNHKRRGSIVMRNLDSAKGNQPPVTRRSGPNQHHKSGKIRRKMRRRRRRRMLANERQGNTAIPAIRPSKSWERRLIVRSTTVNRRVAPRTPPQVRVVPARLDNKTPLNSITSSLQPKKKIQRKRRVRKSVKRRSKRNAHLKNLVGTIHPHTRLDESDGVVKRNRHKPHPHLHVFHDSLPPSQGNYIDGKESHGETHVLKKPVNPLAAASSHFQSVMEVRGSKMAVDASEGSRALRPAMDSASSRLLEHLQNASRNSFPATTEATTVDRFTESHGLSQSALFYQPRVTEDSRSSADRDRIIHPHISRDPSVFHPHQVFRQPATGHPTVLHQQEAQSRTGGTPSSRGGPDLAVHASNPDASAQNSSFRAYSEYIHPHSSVFSHTTEVSTSERGITFTQRYNISVTVDQTPKRVETQDTDKEVTLGEDHFESEHLPEEEQHKRRPKKTFSWRRAAGRRYGDVVVALKNRKKLEVLIGDVDIHLVITRSKTKFGQDFLGFYVEEHNILSPNTTGIIGQFAFKTVGTLNPTHDRLEDDQSETGMKVAVLHQEANMQYRVSEVSGMVSKRRSMLHKSHVRCLLVPNQGEGLVAGSPEDYFLPCLTC